MRYFALLPMLVVTLSLQAQQWTGSSTLDNELFRNGNIRANGLTFGRYGSGIVGDPNPYNIYTTDDEAHDLMIFGGGNLATLHFRLYDGDLKLGSSQTPNTILYNNGSASFGASVGIGTASPEAKFTITQIGNGWNDGLRINRDASNYLTLTEDVTDVRLKNWGSGGLLFFTSTALAAAITSNGNFGIGTPSPSHRMMVQSSASGANVQASIYNPDNQSGAVAGIRFHTASGWNVMLRTRQDNSWLELTNDIGTVSHTWAGGDYFANGRVGIGTTTLGSYKLAVEGKIGAREVNVTTNAWSDHVFNADYKLRPLTEVQQYIEENHHLPEVPSEKEVLANGQNLGEMNAILLKKIEELTLYVIELKKENAATAVEMQAMKKTIQQLIEK